ncbi:hypothetical protein F52700_6107 [Fusarium sp. NRRL 52700]|nr:hypothetical protein F52700_6107 [Fusarium sp. NRRL 52700]
MNQVIEVCLFESSSILHKDESLVDFQAKLKDGTLGTKTEFCVQELKPTLVANYRREHNDRDTATGFHIYWEDRGMEDAYTPTVAGQPYSRGVGGMRQAGEIPPYLCPVCHSKLGSELENLNPILKGLAKPLGTPTGSWSSWGVPWRYSATTPLAVQPPISPTTNDFLLQLDLKTFRTFQDINAKAHMITDTLHDTFQGLPAQQDSQSCAFVEFQNRRTEIDQQREALLVTIAQRNEQLEISGDEPAPIPLHLQPITDRVKNFEVHEAILELAGSCYLNKRIEEKQNEKGHEPLPMMSANMEKELL